MKRVTGVGGVFFKVADPAKTKEWYTRHLGFQTTPWGASMVWGDADPEKKSPGRTEWSPMKSETDYYAPSTHPFMINFRAHDLQSLINVLREEGVTVVDFQDSEYGKFGWIMDPEGRKIELWEPVDDESGEPPAVWNDHVTGLGGIFFKSADPVGIKEWYLKHLGINGDFRWKDLSNPESTELAHTIWSPFKNDTTYFAPSEKSFMFNYRVKDLPALVEKLKAEGVELVGNVDEYPYGKFAWSMDPDGNKIELWEPIDSGFGS